MGMTIAEKIIAAAAGVESVKPGDIHTVQLDRLMSNDCLLYTSPSPRDLSTSRMPSSA